MSEDAVTRLFQKVDDIADRLARVETMLSEREKSKDGLVKIAGWIATTFIAIYAAFFNK